MLPRELARQGVDRSHSFDRHQEGFVIGEPEVAEGRDVLTQVIFQLLDIRTINRPTAAEVSPPGIDLSLEGVFRGVIGALHGHGLRPPLV